MDPIGSSSSYHREYVSDHAIKPSINRNHGSCVADDTPGPDGCPTSICATAFDFDAHVQAKIISPELFARNSAAEADEVSPEDVAQNRLGDCAVMATLCALADSPRGRALIRNCVTENKDAQGNVKSYSVTLFDRQPTLPGVAMHGARWVGRGFSNTVLDACHSLSKVTVTVDGTFACGHAIPRSTDRGTQEVWPLVIEKAIASLVGGYNSMNLGSQAHRTMEMLTGNRAACFSLCESGSAERFLGFRCTASDVAVAAASGKLVVLGSTDHAGQPVLPGKSPPYGLISTHSYQVARVVTINGVPCAVLRNPWGIMNPDPIPLDQLARYFDNVNIGSV